MKIKKLDSVCIWSENYKELAKWYEEKLGLERESELNLPDDTGVNFVIGDVFFWIGAHDEVSGKNKDKYRIMPGFAVDSVTETYNELVKKGVKFIKKPSISPTKDYYVATAIDPEDNIIQFFSDKK